MFTLIHRGLDIDRSFWISICDKYHGRKMRVKNRRFLTNQIPSARLLSISILFTARKKSRKTAQGQEEFFARTAYLYFRRFVDNPRTTHYVVVKKL